VRKPIATSEAGAWSIWLDSCFSRNDRRGISSLPLKETMNNLADLDEKMGADPSGWSTEPPVF